MRILFSVTLLWFCLVSLANAATLYVVVSDNLKGISLSTAEVRRVLLGEISMLKQGRIRLIYPDYSSNEIKILSSFVGKGGSVRNLRAYWSKMIFTGKGNPPYTANSVEELRSMLKEDNAIGVSPDSSDMNVIYTINE